MSLAHEEHEEVAWEVAVKSRPLGVRTASLKWQMVSLGEPGGQPGVAYRSGGRGWCRRDLASVFQNRSQLGVGAVGWGQGVADAAYGQALSSWRGAAGGPLAVCDGGRGLGAPPPPSYHAGCAVSPLRLTSHWPLGFLRELSATWGPWHSRKSERHPRGGVI